MNNFLPGYPEPEVKPCKIVGKTDKATQLNMYQVPLIQFIERTHELCQAAEQIDWDGLDSDLSYHYCGDTDTEPVIGDVKHHHPISANNLSGTRGNAINTLLTAAGFSVMKMLRRIKAESIALCQHLTDVPEVVLTFKISSLEKQWVLHR